jgi:glycine hydroxymethyltransferase
MIFGFEHVRRTDSRIYDLALSEARKQVEQVRLIPSENYASAAVLEALATPFANKYSEGYPGRRYYEGQEFVDQLEALTIERAKHLFGADHANVQPYSGSPANLAAYFALLNPGDRVMGLALPSGGHLTHGARLSFSSVYYESHPYTGNDDGWLDYDQIRSQALEVRPKLIIAGGTAYPRQWDFQAFGDIAEEVDAYFLADIAHINGLIIGKVHPDPVPHAHVVTSTTHKSLRGPRGGLVLCTDEYAEFVDKGCPMVLGGPMAHVMAAKAVAFAEARRPEFADYARQIVDNARALAEGLMKRDITLSSRGTDNHLVLLDVFSSVGLTGRQAESVLLDGGVVTNRNSIPNDPNGAWYASGIRVGTPALTTLGMGTSEMDEVADIMATLLKAATPTTTRSGEPSKAKYSLDDSVSADSRQRCADLLSRFRLYPEVDL